MTRYEVVANESFDKSSTANSAQGSASMRASWALSTKSPLAYGFLFQFKKSAYAGNSGKLQAGECAWADRPMNYKEPTFMQGSVLNGHRWWVYSVWLNDNSKPLTVNFRADDETTRKLVASLFDDARTTNKLFYVHACHGDAAHSLIVTKIGP